MANLETKRERVKRLGKIRQARYRELHKFKSIRADVTNDRYELLMAKLAEKNLTQKQFIENAIDNFLRE